MPRRLASMRGVLAWGSHVPHRRLDRTTIAAVAGGGGGKGTRAVASYDEDTTTMAVAAARAALAGADVRPGALWFSTTTPTYLDKTNATAVHAALRLDRETAAYDAGGGGRAGVAPPRAAPHAPAPPPLPPPGRRRGGAVGVRRHQRGTRRPDAHPRRHLGPAGGAPRWARGGNRGRRCRGCAVRRRQRRTCRRPGARAGVADRGVPRPVAGPR